MPTAAKPRTKRPLQQSKPTALTAPNLQKTSWLVHGFSTRPGGASTTYGNRSLNLGFTKLGSSNNDKRANVESNRRQFLRTIGAAAKTAVWPLITLRQVHSDVIHVVNSTKPGSLTGDGMITRLPGVALGILTADCLPVLLVDKKTRAVGAFHAGWRGTFQRIVEKGVGAMRREFGSRPQDILAAIGPGIQKCCYEVADEFLGKFEAQFNYAGELFHEVKDSDPVREKYPMLFMNQRAPGHGDQCIKLHLDLREANIRQLLAAGVPKKQITAMTDCTSCDTARFFSHRAEKGRTGRMMAVIGIKP